MKITYTEVQDNLRSLSKNINSETYIYDFLRCFGTAKATISRLKNKYSDGDTVISKGQIHFQKVSDHIEQTS